MSPLSPWALSASAELNTVSHLRPLVSEDGIHFSEPDSSDTALFGRWELERLGYRGLPG